MGHGEGPGAAGGSEKRKCHRGREDFGSTSEEEWSTGKVGVTVPDFAFPCFFSHFRTLHRVSRDTFDLVRAVPPQFDEKLPRCLSIRHGRPKLRVHVPFLSVLTIISAFDDNVFTRVLTTVPIVSSHFTSRTFPSRQRSFARR